MHRLFGLDRKVPVTLLLSSSMLQQEDLTIGSWWSWCMYLHLLTFRILYRILVVEYTCTPSAWRTEWYAIVFQLRRFYFKIKSVRLTLWRFLIFGFHNTGSNGCTVVVECTSVYCRSSIYLFIETAHCTSSGKRIAPAESLSCCVRSYVRIYGLR